MPDLSSDMFLADSAIIILTPQLVRALDGDAAAAAVLQKIWWMSDGRQYGSSGWWECSQEEMAIATGLSRDQVKRVLRKLRDDGAVETRESPDIWDRKLHYRPAITDRAESPSRQGGPASKGPKSPETPTGRNRPIERAESPSVPVREEITTTTDVVVGTDEPGFSPPKARARSWNPSPGYLDRARDICKTWGDVEDYIDHYLNRLKMMSGERKRLPSDEEFLTWLIKDENTAKREERNASRSTEPQVDDSGVPLSWKD